MRKDARYIKRSSRHKKDRRWDKKQWKKHLYRKTYDDLIKHEPFASKTILTAQYEWSGSSRLEHKYIQKYLMKNVGRPWADIWKEICQNIKDPEQRKIVLRTADMDDIGKTQKETCPNASGFEVVDGIFQYKKDNRPKIKYIPGNYDPTVIYIDNIEYTYIDSLWFKTQVELKDNSYIDKNNKFVEVIDKIYSIQSLSKKEIEKLGLRQYEKEHNLKKWIKRKEE